MEEIEAKKELNRQRLRAKRKPNKASRSNSKESRQAEEKKIQKNSEARRSALIHKVDLTEEARAAILRAKSTGSGMAICHDKDYHHIELDPWAWRVAEESIQTDEKGSQ